MKTDHITEGLVRIRDNLLLESQRDILAQAANKLQDMDRALSELHAMVQGECPSLLNEDSGGNAELDSTIRDLIAQ